MNTIAMNMADLRQEPTVEMHAPGGTKQFAPRSKLNGPVGISAMIIAHAALIYALTAGLAQKAIEIIKKPLEATIVQEIKLPPPPPLPPKPKPREIPKVETPPPPAYVPPPEVVPPAVVAPAITAVQTQVPVAPPPPAPVVAPAAPAKVDLAVTCPKQVKPEIPQRALDDGIGGVVKAEAHLRGGKIVDVRFLSGPRIYYAAVRAAMMKYECNSSGDAEVVATQEFSFRIE
jgi:periplasmic protein TonB